ncbi:putative transporter [Rhypophila decipiens]|uniref:Transporter n=1 Tax=Rhypophila decipiens TaxID=261697 RepID=A0AAN6Y2P1_9PEZI|nr:putative transporter [Rhypophila decipiens]
MSEKKDHVQDPEKQPSPFPPISTAKDVTTIQVQTTISDSDSSKDGVPSKQLSKTSDDIRQQILTQQAELVASQKPSTSLSSLWNRSKTPRVDPNSIATQPSVFDDPSLAPYFQPSPEYENRHRFDPSFRWTWAEEMPLIKRIDWKVTAWSCIAFFALDLDRSNISQANTDNFLEDLGLDTNDYNLGQTVFRVAFLLAELPSQLISKKVGPDRWIPAQMILWSIVSAAQFWLKGRQSFLVTRALIGLLQGGFIPDVILYMSYFFKGTELPFRLALFWMANRLTDVVSPLLAYGLLRLRGYHGLEGWRWLFLLEGILTLIIGIWSVFAMVPSPTQTKARWRPNGWFTEREEKIMVNRILRDDPSKSDMHNRQAITSKLLWESLCDYDLWPIYLIGLTFAVPAGPPDQYLTLTLRQLGFDTFDSNLLSIPCQITTTLNMLLLTYLSEKLNQRAFSGLFTQLWFLPCVISLAVLPPSTNRWAAYALVTVLLSYPSPHPLQVGWCSRNSNTVRTRTVSAALYNIAVQLGSIISSNIYRRDDRPEYRRGNRVLVGICCWNIALYLGVKGYYWWRNKKRDEKWDQMGKEERERYLETTGDKGSKRLDFRFAS